MRLDMLVWAGDALVPFFRELPCIAWSPGCFRFHPNRSKATTLVMEELVFCTSPPLSRSKVLIPRYARVPHVAQILESSQTLLEVLKRYNSRTDSATTSSSSTETAPDSTA